MATYRVFRAPIRDPDACHECSWRSRTSAAATPLAWLLAGSALIWGAGLGIALIQDGPSLSVLAPEALGALTRLGHLSVIVGLVMGAVVLAVRWRQPPRRRLPRLVMALALFHAAGLVVLGGLPLRANSSPHADVILIVIDTLRTDFVDAERTPHVHGLGEDGYRFSRAYASAPWTLPSFGSLLTGRHVRDHGAGVDPEKDLGDGNRALRDDIETLAERFALHGYQTASLTTNPWLSAGSGIERGFEHSRNLLLDDILLPGTFEFTNTARFASARIQTERALWLLRLRDPKRPLFLMLHYMDTHQPRQPPKYWLEQERRTRPAPEIEVAYGASVRLVDAELGRLVAALKQRDHYASSILVVTSDHGEGLEEQGLREGHGKNLFAELVRIPLAIKPAAATPPQRCDGLISHIDLGSTLLLLAGIDQAFGDGLPRVTQSGDCADGADAVFHAMTSHPPSSDGLVSGRAAVVWNHPDHWLGFDLESDPDYRHPSAITSEPRLEEHVRAQRELTQRAAPTKTREFDPELVETLGALGYLQ